MNRALIVLIAATITVAVAQTPCEQLQSLKLPDTTITMVTAVPAGAFKNPALPPAPQPDAIDPPPPPPPANLTPQMLPAYCRVFATLKPSPDSDIKIEVWLPLGAAWNGKYEAVGGGGWAGVISYPALATAVQEGYATSSTDTGHEGGNAKLRGGSSGKDCRFLLSRRARNDGQGEGCDYRFLWPRSSSVLLERVFHRRTPGINGGAALSRRFRRHRGRRTG